LRVYYVDIVSISSAAAEREKIRMCDWCKAEEHLSACEKTYSAIDTAGYLILNYVICPLRERLSKGERSDELFKEIMEMAL
jgi:hypothetical protein